MEILWKGPVSVELRANRPKLYGNCAFLQNFHTMKLGDNSEFYAVNGLIRKYSCKDLHVTFLTNFKSMNAWMLTWILTSMIFKVLSNLCNFFHHRKSSWKSIESAIFFNYSLGWDLDDFCPTEDVCLNHKIVILQGKFVPFSASTFPQKLIKEIAAVGSFLEKLHALNVQIYYRERQYCMISGPRLRFSKVAALEHFWVVASRTGNALTDILIKTKNIATVLNVDLSLRKIIQKHEKIVAQSRV